MSARVNEIAAMIRAAIDAGRMPAEIDASAFSDKVVLTRDFGLRIHTTGEALSSSKGGLFPQIMPDAHLIDTWLKVGDGMIVLKTKVAGTLPTGRAFEYPFCQIFHVDADGVIADIDYYTCPQQHAILMPFADKFRTTERQIEQVYPATN